MTERSLTTPWEHSIAKNPFPMSMKLFQGKEKTALYHIEAQEAQNQEYGSKYGSVNLKEYLCQTSTAKHFNCPDSVLQIWVESYGFSVIITTHMAIT